MALVVTLNGARVYDSAVPRKVRDDAEFEETKHPRNHGKFAKKGSGSTGAAPEAPAKKRPAKGEKHENAVAEKGVTGEHKIVVKDPGAKRYGTEQTVHSYIESLGGDRQKALRRLLRDHQAGRIEFEAPPKPEPKPEPKAEAKGAKGEGKSKAESKGAEKAKSAPFAGVDTSDKDGKPLDTKAYQEFTKAAHGGKVSAETTEALQAYVGQRSQYREINASLRDGLHAGKSDTKHAEGIINDQLDFFNGPEQMAREEKLDVSDIAQPPNGLPNKEWQVQFKEYQQKIKKRLLEKKSLTERAKELNLADNTAPLIKKLDAAFESSSLPQDTKMYRGVNAEMNIDQLKPGSTIENPAYTSTSLSKKWASSFSDAGTKQVMEIQGKAGQKALPTGGAHGTGREREVMLPRDVKLKYTGSRDEDGMKVHTFEYV